MIRGRVIFVGQPDSGVSKSGKQWSKQLFAIETESQYPKKVAFGVMNNKFTMNMGDVVEIEVDAQSREYNGKWYTDLTAWRCNNISVPAQAPSQPQQQNVYQQTAPQGYQAYQPAPANNMYPQGAQPYNPAPPQSTDDIPF